MSLRFTTDRSILQQEAKSFCENDGTHLVSIEGVVENNFVFAYAYDSLVESVWTGLNSMKVRRK